jgi:hypothetical protein
VPSEYSKIAEVGDVLSMSLIEGFIALSAVDERQSLPHYNMHMQVSSWLLNTPL